MFRDRRTKTKAKMKIEERETNMYKTYDFLPGQAARGIGDSGEPEIPAKIFRETRNPIIPNQFKPTLFGGTDFLPKNV